MLRSIIVDDEVMARKSLERLCEKADAIELVGVCEDAEETLELMKKISVDLLFLDIEMPGLSGLELLDQLSVMPQVIFTTSNKEYAFEAYEYDVTDFLKKPISQLRFYKSLEKADAKNRLLSEISKKSASTEIYVKSDGKYIRIPFESILYFENVGDYVMVVSEVGKHIIHGTLKGIDSRMDYPRLIKIHRSFIINLDKVENIEDNSVLIAKKVIPISRAHRSVLMQHLNFL